MTEFADPRLAPWGNFYVIVGSAGAALVGIQFVTHVVVTGGDHDDTRAK